MRSSLSIREGLAALIVVAAACGGRVIESGSSADASQDCAASSDSEDNCEYQPRDSPIGEIEGFVVENPLLDRRSPILLRYPIDSSGPLPVIVWTHGGDYDLAGHRKSAAWGATMAAAGYAVIHVAHVPPTAANISLLCEVAGVLPSECSLAEFAAPIVTHPADVSTVIDELAAIEEWASELTGVAFDHSKILSAGWSAGSLAPMGLVGAERIVSPTVERYASADDRILGAIALSPQGDGFSGYFVDGADNSWDAITKPVLVMTGENDWKEGNPELFGPIRRHAFDYLPGASGRQRLLYSLLPLGRGGHGTYNLADRESSDESLVTLSLALQSAARAFADDVLLDAEAARLYLDSSSLEILAGVDDVEVEVK